MNKIKKKIYKKIYSLLRNKILNDITRNLGKVVETDDNFVCYVDNKQLKKYKKGKYMPTYDLMLKSKKMYSDEILNAYKVNKPIHYVIEGMNFDNALIIRGPSDSNITFRSCMFKDEITISSNSDIILENNKYYNLCSFYTRKSRCFLNVEAKNITFINDYFINSELGHHPTKFGIDINTNNLKIINSTFDMKKDDGMILIRSKNVDIKNSDINCYKSIYLKSDEINTEGCLINSKTEITIENKNNNDVLGFTSPKTIYNGVDLSNYYCITPHTLELQKARISLIEKLRKLRDKCISINSTELKEVENTLNNRSVIKTMKK